jgi:hypothetical protein
MRLSFDVEHVSFGTRAGGRGAIVCNVDPTVAKVHGLPALSAPQGGGLTLSRLGGYPYGRLIEVAVYYRLRDHMLVDQRHLGVNNDIGPFFLTTTSTRLPSV